MDNKSNGATNPAGRAKLKKWKKMLGISIALVLTIALGVGAVITNGFGLISQQAKAEISAYQVVDLTIGNLSKSVTGTGSLALDQSESITVPSGLKVSSIQAQVGQSVAAGEVLVKLDTQSIQDRIDSILTDLSTSNTTLASLSGDTTSSSIKATVEGRIKLSYGEAGDDVAEVMQQYGALLVLSVDGTMRVDIALDGQKVEAGQEVKAVLSDKTVITGVVSSVSSDGTKASVLVSDKKPTVGEQLTIKDADNLLLGTGTAQINNALRITGTVGTISSVHYSLGSAVSKNATLYTLKNLPITKEYEAALAEHEELLQELEEMQVYQKKPVITATVNGIVDEIGVSEGQTLTEDGTIGLLRQDSVILTVAVDELDILTIKTGMQAEVTLSAVENETFQGTVVFISAAGTTTSNVTTYPVQIRLTNDTRFLPGMRASADIVVQESQNALLVPVSALNTARGETYVYVYTGALPEDSASDPGTKTVITTGLSDESYAQVLSGLSVGQQVVTTRSAGTVTASASTQQQNSMMGGMMDFSGGGASMGTPPSGGGQGGPPAN